MRGTASGSGEPVPDRQDPAKQVNARLLAPAVVLALARDRAASLLGVPDESGTNPEHADENKGALAHTTRVVLRKRGVHGARGRSCSCSSEAQARAGTGPAFGSHRDRFAETGSRWVEVHRPVAYDELEATWADQAGPISSALISRTCWAKYQLIPCGSLAPYVRSP